MEKPFATSSGREALLEPSWPELLGCNNWEGLLQPFDLSLRRLILRCGNFSEATYDAFNGDVRSAYAGSSKYGKKDFFNKVMLDSAANYQVAYFLYATAEGMIIRRVFTRSLARNPWDNKSNFMGYIATTTDEVSRALGRREIYVVWRGTAANTEKKAELYNFCMKSAEELLAHKDHHGCCCCCKPKPKVMSGFLKIYTSRSNNPDNQFAKYSARQQVQKMIQNLTEKYKNENMSIIVTGHSLGASLSVLSAFDLVENVVKDIPVSAIVFACPKVGNRAFRNRVNGHPNLKILHIKNKHDWVPTVPFFFLGYVDIGINLKIDNDKSPYLQRSCCMSDWHNLEVMLHVVAGWNGAKGTFKLEVKRSPALVNKYTDLLNDSEFVDLVPAEWWVEEKKGMVRHDDGEWVHAPPSDEDKPVPEFSD